MGSVAINEALHIVYILEFKRSTDKDERFLEVNEAKANEQHKIIIGALKAAGPEWKFRQINFVVGNHGSDVESKILRFPGYHPESTIIRRAPALRLYERVFLSLSPHTCTLRPIFSLDPSVVDHAPPCTCWRKD